MPTYTIPRIALLPVLAALILALVASAADTDTARADDNLPSHTSPIDVTGLRLQLQASVPHRDTGQPVNTPLPVELLGPKFNALMATPLSTKFDEHWNVQLVKETGKTRRQTVCDRIRQELDDVAKQAGPGFSVYDWGCNLATKGTLLVKRDGDALTFGYTLLDSSIEFYVTTPGTCHRDTFAPFCPNDPGAKVSLVPQIIMTLRTPQVCLISASPVTAAVQSPRLETRGVVNVAAFVDTLFLGGWYSGLAEQAIRQVATDQIQQDGALAEMDQQVEGALAELRDSAPCRDRSSPAGRAVAAFSELETAIEPAQRAIILRLVHPPIVAPRFQNVSLPYGPDTCLDGYVWREAFTGDHVCVTPAARAQAAADNAAASRREPNGGLSGPDTCKQGFVWREAHPEDHVCVSPERRTQTANDNAQASERTVLGAPPPRFINLPRIVAPSIAAAGDTIKVSGEFFPQTGDPTVLSLSLERDATSACLGGATELEWGPASGAQRVEKLPSNGVSCAYRHEVKSLPPTTAYRFRARDCNVLTCSPWSAPVTLTTGATRGPTAVTLTLDGAALGTATVTAQGTFDADVVIPAGTAAGNRTIRAASGDAVAEESLRLTTTGEPLSLELTFAPSDRGGCPGRIMLEHQRAVTYDKPFALLGTGFAPGPVTVHLGSATGTALGTATVGADGQFCHNSFRGLPAPPVIQYGDHLTLVAVQNGTVRATLRVRVIWNTPVK